MILVMIHLAWIALAAHQNHVAITKRRTDHNSWKVFFDRKYDKMEGGKNGGNNSEDPLTDLNDARVSNFIFFVLYRRESEITTRCF